MNNMLKNLVIWLVIGLVLMTVFNQFNTRQAAVAPMEYSQFLEEVKAGRIDCAVLVRPASGGSTRCWGAACPRHRRLW